MNSLDLTPCNAEAVLTTDKGGSPLFKGLQQSDYVYFVHSYYCELCDNTIATADYIQPYSAALQKDNFFATQFHPEKKRKCGQEDIAELH